MAAIADDVDLVAKREEVAKLEEKIKALKEERTANSAILDNDLGYQRIKNRLQELEQEYKDLTGPFGKGLLDMNQKEVARHEKEVREAEAEIAQLKPIADKCPIEYRNNPDYIRTHFTAKEGPDIVIAGIKLTIKEGSRDAAKVRLHQAQQELPEAKKRQIEDLQKTLPEAIRQALAQPKIILEKLQEANKRKRMLEMEIKQLEANKSKFSP